MVGKMGGFGLFGVVFKGRLSRRRRLEFKNQVKHYYYSQYEGTLPFKIRGILEKVG
ncbi:hypothetical protein BTURTLESOX_348 [bacterium endosymbiont of Bathymodiolus sp. 5 South]|jgi:hypothetical protein|nr:hypothetical protein [uncultured Gammaproteobacteria bacterium]SHN93917.1 hypothetical protein BCLUESOX_1222 [bacterium endosymbiont of Bathymodiolus sp. 5 South]SSC09271.1 hypothetical protein BTURTLESOX_348 [bacterium endosymbiont of Bathymodiolus sp. 5 South]VVH59930.1 hypothetical protein BSPCLSOX_437 [uncultured Gammaproteobacteria bacterium]VVH62495.1 hypothetical protein BSPWISOX_162 [uncultured Gammaproteobacteria bacterium]